MNLTGHRDEPKSRDRKISSNEKDNEFDENIDGEINSKKDKKNDTITFYEKNNEENKISTSFKEIDDFMQIFSSDGKQNVCKWIKKMN